MRSSLLALVSSLLTLSGCGHPPCGSSSCSSSGGGAAGANGGGQGGGGSGGGAPQARCQAAAVPCVDESIMHLRLFDTVNPDAVTEEGAAPDFKTRIDARAGGASSTQSYQYLKFTEGGLEKLQLGDEAAFTSLDWDIAVRRYVLRINAGVSGPSCTEAARTAPGTTYESLTQAPDGLSWRSEEYFNDTCGFVPDTSGIGAPGTALSSFWTYQQCVQMSGNVYVLHLRDGRYVKLQVLSYYAPAAQETCDTTGAVPTPNEAGMVRIRWGFIGAPP